MKLSVVILNYNVRYFLELCLKSVEAAIQDIDAEIIVVDNLSTDDSCDMVKALFPKVILIENTVNYGFSKGNNIGVAKAKGEYVCILNPDTVVAEDTFKKVLAFAEKTPDLGIVGCKLIDGTGYFLPESKRNIPTPWVSLQKIFGNSKPYYANHLNENETGKVDILVGAFMFLKRQVYNEINGFDEDFFMYGEDMDISYRVLKAGYQNYYNADTTVIHYKGESTLKDKVYAKRFNEAMQMFFKKHFKTNIFFEAMILLGVKAITILNLQPKQETVEISSYVMVSDELNDNFKSKLTKPISLFSDASDLQPYQQIIFDQKFITFKEIIERMTKWSENKKLSFKILPKDAQFIIGSNSSKSRGEVLKF
uniref:glycosyltransferase family 2 protein n=1 Tax=Gelidibacter sp. TaxID=2018083 RepID=UPI00404A2F32